MRTIAVLLLITFIPNLALADIIYLRPKGKILCKILDMTENEIVYRIKTNRGKLDTLSVSYENTLAFKYKDEILNVVTSETEADSLRVAELTKETLEGRLFNPGQIIGILAGVALLSYCIAYALLKKEKVK